MNKGIQILVNNPVVTTCNKTKKYSQIINNIDKHPPYINTDVVLTFVENQQKVENIIKNILASVVDKFEDLSINYTWNNDIYFSNTSAYTITIWDDDASEVYYIVFKYDITNNIVSLDAFTTSVESVGDIDTILPKYLFSIQSDVIPDIIAIDKFLTDNLSKAILICINSLK